MQSSVEVPALKRVPNAEVVSFIVNPREDLQVYDPIVCHLTGYGEGRVAFVVVCYDMAWSAFFGNIGDRLPAEFIKSVSLGYLAGKMRGQFNERTRRHEQYLDRVLMAVQAAL